MNRTVSTKKPLEILLVRSQIRTADESLIDTLVRELVVRFEGDPARPFSRPIGIGVRVASTEGQLRRLAERALERSHKLVVVPLMNNDLIISSEDNALRELLGQFAVRTDRDQLRFVPASLTEARVSLFPNVQSLLRGQQVASSETLAVALMQECIAFLRGDLAEAMGAAFEVFFSHAKTDGLALAARIKQDIENEWRVRGFFDSRDIEPGSDWRQTLHKHAGRCAMVVVQTDIYSEREWCQREIIEAKKNDVPILVLNALSKRESRSFPYLGNVPILRIDLLNPDVHEIVTELMAECLRVTYFQAHAQNSDDSVRAIAHAPELVTLLPDGGDLIYSDPPLSETERALITSRTKATLRTRREIAWQVPAFEPGKISVAVSISEPPEADLGERGLIGVHLDLFWMELMRALFMTGVNVSYGGDHRATGFTEQLINLVRAYHREGQPASKVTNFLSFHLAKRLSQGDRVNLLDAMSIESCQLPSDIADDVDSAYARSRAFTQMRQEMAQQTDVRIVCGGRLTGFGGRYAGIAEEALIHLSSNKPVYVVGLLGGCAQRIADWAEAAPGAVNPLMWQGAESDARNTLVNDYIRQSDSNLDESRFAPMEHALHLKTWLNDSSIPSSSRWNGLTSKENSWLANVTQADEAIALIMRGLSKKFSGHLGRPK